MPALSELQVPATRAMSDIPVPDTGISDASPQQRDAEAFQATAGEFRKGLRSSINSLGAAAHALAGAAGDAMGLTGFAQERFKEAEDYVNFADKVGPVVRDYRMVKDLNDATSFVLGLGGQAAGSMIPALVGGAAGAKYGLRGAIGGTFAGSFVPESGEQALTVKDTNATPGEKLRNAVGKGAVNAALDTASLAVPGAAVVKGARGVAQPFGKTIAKTVAAEAGTEALQEKVGQEFHAQLDPNRDSSGDTAAQINAALGGAVGGGMLGGGAMIASKAGESLAKSRPKAEESATLPGDRAQTVDEARGAMGGATRPLDPDMMPPDSVPDHQIPEWLDRHDEASKKDLESWKQRHPEKYGKVDLEDPIARDEMAAGIKKEYSDSVDKPFIARALDSLKKVVGKIVPPEVPGEKSSKVRTAVDAAVFDEVYRSLPEHYRDAMTPAQRIELADQVKHYAMHVAGRTEEQPGPGAPIERRGFTEIAPSTTPMGYARHEGGTDQPLKKVVANDAGGLLHHRDAARATEATKFEGARPYAKVMPHALMDIFGDKLEPMLSKVQDMLGKTSLRQGQPVDYKKAISHVTKSRGALTSQLEDVVRTHLRVEIAGEPTTRDAVIGAMTSDLQDRLHNGVDDWKSFNKKLDYAFGDNADAVLEAFDKLREDVTRGYEDFGDIQQPRTDESAAAKLKQNERFRVSEEDQSTDVPTATDAEPNPTGELPTKAEDAHPYRDKRLGVPMDEAATRSAIKALRDEYPKDAVKFRAEPLMEKYTEVVDGKEVTKERISDKFMIHAVDAEAAVGFSKDELARVQEQHGKAGLENSVITVVRKDPDNPERNKTVAISIPNLVAETARTFNWTGRKGPNYVHAIVMEGLSRLMSDPDMVRFAPSTLRGVQFTGAPEVSSKSQTGTITAERHPGLGMGSLAFPDDMFVAKVGGERFTWGDIKGSEMTSRELSVQRLTNDMVQAARHADKLSDIEDKLLPQMERNLERLEKRGDNFTANRVREAIAEVEAEVHRRQEAGDAPVFEMSREMGTTLDEATLADEDRSIQGETRGPRNYDEQTGLRVGREALRKGPKENTKVDESKVQKLPPGPKFSEMRLGVMRATPEQEQQVRDFVKKVLGDKADVMFKEMEKAGSFARLSGVETLGISIHALDPLGVGRHEAAHALFARLREDNAQAANTLSAAAGSPSIMAQLRQKLSGHPEAIKQLSDHEERLAYMYEFWAVGELEIGPKATGIFQKVRDFFKKAAHLILGVGDDVGTLQKAEEILQAFHDGRLAERSVAAQVLAQTMKLGPIEALWSGRVGDLAARVSETADGYIRSFKIPAMTAVADKMFNIGEGKSGLVQSRHVVRNQYMNRVALATRGLDAAAVGRVLASLQTKRDTTTNLAERGAVRAIRGLMDDLFKYMVDSNVKAVVWNDTIRKYEALDLHRVADYFPRAYDRNVINERWGEFVDMLKRHGVEDAESVAQRLVTGSKASPEESDFTAGLTYYAPNTMTRKITSIPEAELAPFMKKDLNSILYDYVNYTTRRGEYAKRFGNQGEFIEDAKQQAEKEGATSAQVKSFSQYVQAMEGSLGSDIDPKLRKFFGGVMTYQNLRLLPLALFSSLIDPAGIVVRGGKVGDAFKAFTRGVRDLVSTKDDEMRAFARAVGAINEATDEHMVAEMYGANYGSNIQKWLNDKLFKLNGMESWNNSMRVAASGAAHDFIIRHTTEPNAHSKRYLAELGLTAESVHIADGKLDLTPEIVDAVNRWVDGAVLRPHAGIRPIWMSDPHFMLVGHLKQFTYSFQKTIVARVAHETLHGNYTPLIALSSYVPLIIAADVLRAAVTPGGLDDERLRRWGLSDWFMHGINRAGISGPGQYALDAAQDVNRGHVAHAVSSALGPSFQQLSDLLSAATGHGSLAREGLRAIPPVPALFPKG
jgi:hypothetical protein